jgi:hypothetical protein
LAITIHFTPNLARHVECPALSARGSTVREALDSAFAQNPKVRDFVLDEHGVLRKHMTLFLDGEQIADREKLSDPVRDGAEIWVMQALSGG